MTACHDVSATPVATAGIRRVALIGSPNAGKTSVFNHLTGLRAKTGNYPGVTVGRSVGTTTADGVPIAVEDLPGTYSLDPISPDEQVVTDLLAGTYPDIDRPDALVLVADVTTLRRSIMLIGQVLRLDLPCLLTLTMGDELTSRGGRIDVDALSTALGIPVVGGRRAPRVGHRHSAGATGVVREVATPADPPPARPGRNRRLGAVGARSSGLRCAATGSAHPPNRPSAAAPAVGHRRLLHRDVLLLSGPVHRRGAAARRHRPRVDLAGWTGRPPCRQSRPARLVESGNHRRGRHRAAVHPADRAAVLPARVPGERRLHVAGGVLDGPGDGQDRAGGPRLRRDVVLVRMRDPGHHGDPDVAVVTGPHRHHRHRAVDDVLGPAAGVHVAGRPAGRARKRTGGDSAHRASRCSCSIWPAGPRR